MMLRKPIPPSEAVHAFQTALARFLPPDDPLSAPLRIAPPDGYPVYVLQLPDVRLDDGLAKATESAWRFLSDRSGPLEANVTASRKSGELRLSSVSQDREVLETLEALRRLETMPELQDDQYDVRILSIPAVLLEGFWLKSSREDGDWIVPTLSASPEIQTGRPYRVGEFLGAVRPIAARFGEWDKVPE